MTKQEVGFGEGIQMDLGLPEEPVVDDEEWELGPACGLEPEECESCQ